LHYPPQDFEEFLASTNAQKKEVSGGANFRILKRLRVFSTFREKYLSSYSQPR
jgi:hypothetical protein